MTNTGICTATNSGHECTRDAGHGPPHEHEDDNGEVAHRWLEASN